MYRHPVIDAFPYASQGGSGGHDVLTELGDQSLDRELQLLLDPNGYQSQGEIPKAPEPNSVGVIPHSTEPGVVKYVRTADLRFVSFRGDYLKPNGETYLEARYPARGLRARLGEISMVSSFAHTLSEATMQDSILSDEDLAGLALPPSILETSIPLTPQQAPEAQEQHKTPRLSTLKRVGHSALQKLLHPFSYKTAEKEQPSEP